MKKEKKKLGRPKLADKETKKKAIISIVVSLLISMVLILGGAITLSDTFNVNDLKGTVTTPEKQSLEGFTKVSNIYDENKDIDVSFEKSIEVSDGYIVLPKFYGEKATINGTSYSLDTNWFLFKYDKNGNLLWKKVYEKPAGSTLNHIVKLNDGFAVLGVSKDIGNFTVYTGTSDDSFESEQKMLYYKFDNNYNINKLEIDKWHTESTRNYTWGFWNASASVTVSGNIIYSVYSDSSNLGAVKIDSNTGKMIDSRSFLARDYLPTKILVDDSGNIVVFANNKNELYSSNIYKLQKDNLLKEEPKINFESEMIVSVIYDKQNNYIISLKGINNGRIIKVNKNDFSIMMQTEVDKDYIYYGLASYKENIYSVGINRIKQNTSIIKYNNDLEKIYSLDDKENVMGNLLINNNENIFILVGNSSEPPILGKFIIYKKQYSITSEESSYGKVVISNEKPVEGETMTLTITPKDNYYVGEVKIVNSLTGEDVTKNVNYNSNNNTFIMPGYDVKIVVTYALTPTKTTTNSGDDNKTTTKMTTTTNNNITTNSTTKTTIKNPKTYDNVFVYVILGGVGIIILVASILFFRKVRKK